MQNVCRNTDFTGSQKICIMNEIVHQFWRSFQLKTAILIFTKSKKNNYYNICNRLMVWKLHPLIKFHYSTIFSIQAQNLTKISEVLNVHQTDLIVCGLCYIEDAPPGELYLV